jgi:hypothetical protein
MIKERRFDLCGEVLNDMRSRAWRSRLEEGRKKEGLEIFKEKEKRIKIQQDY